ncbi:hypothetical protein J2T13_005184 [Paenibacillus sp. DS2015]|uniref:hypothetical protein n=1 Tax=Paenibacillus sp. DS2015 TaxID=3373917 RepID=UPI003D223F5E
MAVRIVGFNKLPRSGLVQHYIHASEPDGSSVREKQSAGKQVQRTHPHKLTVLQPLPLVA